MEPESASDPAVVIMRSAVSMLSLIRTGIPWSGPRGPLSRLSLSSASAMERASGFSSMTALMAGPRLSILSIRARYFSANDRAVNSPDFMRACKSVTVASSSSNALWGAANVRARAAPLASRLYLSKSLRSMEYQYASKRSASRARSSTCGRMAFSNWG